MPIQHASDGVLARLGRRYGNSFLRELIGELRRRAPGIALRTTLMTGFPGESEKDFSELLDFVEYAKFERLGVFAYSREEGTRAAAMSCRTPKKVALARRSELLRVQTPIARRADSARIGREYDAIAEYGSFVESRGAFMFKARTYAEAPQVDGCITIIGGAGHAELDHIEAGSAAAMQERAAHRMSAEQGGFVKIRITRMKANGLYGELLT
jgi:ribosomal protein S12 methylthiotransferase